MSLIWFGILALSMILSLTLGRGANLAAAIPQGAQAGVSLAISMAGSVCLWTGVGRVMEKSGITGFISRMLKPVLWRLFPSCHRDQTLANALSANVCANFLGLGNAATPMGIQAAKRLAIHSKGVASDELCRLIVLNTASIQLIPANVAAIRVACGCSTPFDILPCVWFTSLCSASAGLLCAWLLGKVWGHG